MKLNLPPLVDPTMFVAGTPQRKAADALLLEAQIRQRQIAKALRDLVARAKVTNITVPDPEDPKGELWFNPQGAVSQYWHDLLDDVANQLDPDKKEGDMSAGVQDSANIADNRRKIKRLTKRVRDLELLVYWHLSTTDVGAYPTARKAFKSVETQVRKGDGP